MTAARFTRADLIEEATLHAQGLELQATCQAGNKRLDAAAVERTRARIPVAWAIVAAVGGDVPKGRAAS